MKPIPETRTEIIELFTSEKVFCKKCNQNLDFKKRSNINCPLIPSHQNHVVLECSGCGTMTTVDKICTKFNDFRDLMKNNQINVSLDDHQKYPEWLSYYCRPDVETEMIYPSVFDWEYFWKEIQSHTNLRRLIGIKDKNKQDIFYWFDSESQTVIIKQPEENPVRISLDDFKKTHEKMNKNKIENKDYFDNFSDFEGYVYAVWRFARPTKNF
ncbi:MAG: hypothetical protein PVH93_08555 [Nitrosopumilaceae archaeon]|jgi:hypothetical protein